MHNMIMVMLLIHVGLALLSLFTAGGVVVATRQHQPQQAQNRSRIMWIGTLSTLASGTVLSILSHSSIKSTCLSMLSFLVVVFAASYYRRTASDSIRK